MADEEAKEAEAPEEGEAREERPLDPVALKDRQISELTEDLKRLQAEFDNFKKRSEKEWNERSKLATQRLMGDLLAVLDSFDKAIENAGKDCGRSELKTGLESLQKQLYQILQREGLREIKAQGRFDPFMHEALMREEREDAEDGKILEVYQKGYALGQKALRPAKVKVAKKKEPQPTEEKEDHAHDDQADHEHESEEKETQQR